MGRTALLSLITSCVAVETFALSPKELNQTPPRTPINMPIVSGNMDVIILRWPLNVPSLWFASIFSKPVSSELN